MTPPLNESDGTLEPSVENFCGSAEVVVTSQDSVTQGKIFQRNVINVVKVYV